MACMACAVGVVGVVGVVKGGTVGNATSHRRVARNPARRRREAGRVRLPPALGEAVRLRDLLDIDAVV